MNIIYLRTIENWQEGVRGKINKWNIYVKKTEYWFRKNFYMPISCDIYPNNIQYILPYKATETKKILKFLNKKNVQGIVLDKKLSKNYDILNQIKENKLI